MLGKYIGDLKREFSGYNGGRLLKDLMAGITVAAVALPLALAFGVSSGADAAAGLVTAIIGGFIMALLSGASYQISGPTGAMTAILVTIVAKYTMQGMFVTCLMAGILLLICGIFKLGRLVNYIPLPVITGFTSGISLVIALGQIDNLFGTKSSGEVITQKIASYFTLGFHVNVPGMLVGLGVIVLMILWPKKWNARVPGSLVGIIAATVAVTLLKLDIPTVGEIPRGLMLDNRFSFSQLKLGELTSLLSPAVSIAALAMIESLLCASSASRMKKENYDPDRELISQGIGNLVLPFFGGVPATAAIARTSVAIKSGGQTRITGMFHSVVLLLCVFVLSPVFKNLPLSALAGVLMVTAFRMNEWENIKQYFGKKLRGPILKYLVTMVATVVFDLTGAIVLGIIAALAVFVAKQANLQVTVSKIENSKLHTGTRDVEDSCKDAVVVYVAGPLFFMNAQKLIRELGQIEGYKTVILSMRGVPSIDISAVSTLSDYYDECVSKGIDLVFCGTQETVLNQMKGLGFYDKVNQDHFYFSVDRVITRMCGTENAKSVSI